MIVCKAGEAQTITIKNKTIKGLSVTMSMIAAAANQALNTGDYNWRQVTVKMVLRRKGREIVILSTTLDVLCQVSCYDDSCYYVASYSNQTLPAFAQVFVTDGITTFPAAGVIGTYVIPVDFSLHGVIEVRGEDELQIDLSVPTSVFGANVNSSLSSFSLSETDAVGIEFGVPKLRVDSIQPAQQNLSIAVGNNVEKIYFVNLDKTNILTVNQVISNLTVKSNKLNYTKQYNEVLAMRVHQSNWQTPDRLGQTFKLLDEPDCDNVQVEAQFVTANVTTGSNYLVSFQSDFEPSSLRKYELTQRKIALKAVQQKFGGGSGVTNELAEIEKQLAAIKAGK